MRDFWHDTTCFWVCYAFWLAGWCEPGESKFWDRGICSRGQHILDLVNCVVHIHDIGKRLCLRRLVGDEVLAQAPVSVFGLVVCRLRLWGNTFQFIAEWTMARDSKIEGWTPCYYVRQLRKEIKSGFTVGPSSVFKSEISDAQQRKGFW